MVLFQQISHCTIEEVKAVVLVFQFTASDTGLSHVIAHHISADLII
jgi:hypothetical protein